MDVGVSLCRVGASTRAFPSLWFAPECTKIAHRHSLEIFHRRLVSQGILAVLGKSKRGLSKRGLNKRGLNVLVHDCQRLPTIVVILRRKVPLERGPQKPQKWTIVDDCAQIAESGLKPPFESPHLDLLNSGNQLCPFWISEKIAVRWRSLLAGGSRIFRGIAKGSAEGVSLICSDLFWNQKKNQRAKSFRHFSTLFQNFSPRTFLEIKAFFKRIKRKRPNRFAR